MAQFRKAVLTEKGLALIQKTQIQEIKLEFTKIATGAGEYGETEELKDITALKDKRQEFGISSFSVIDPKTVKMSAAITNIELLTPYFIGEIGVYALDPDEGEILYSLAVAYPGKADYLPAYNGSVPVSVYLDTYQAVSDAKNVTVQANLGAYALAKDFNALQNKVEELQSQISKLGRVRIGPAETELETGDTLFIVDGVIAEKFEAASYSNMVFSNSPPEGESEKYWADFGTNITDGKLSVSEEETVPDDTVFLAKV
ncbi:MAG TPA: phage tail protein [Candidatus Blautia faecipullorum]|nr:phage tail protein [Candidatus Blautia faecipullorum]